MLSYLLAAWLVLSPRRRCICVALLLRQILLLGEVVALGHRLVLIEEESRAVERVGALLRYRVDDAARARSELGVELAGEQLEFLDGFDRDAGLRAAVAVVERVVVAGAVERVVRVLRRLVAGDLRSVRSASRAADAVDAQIVGDTRSIIAAARARISTSSGVSD